MNWPRAETALLDPRWRPWADWLLSQAPSAQVTSTYRSSTQQRRIYRRSQAGLHAYPVAPPGKSMHEIGMALDMIDDDAELRRLGTIWRKAGGVWGGDADPIHFEPGPSMLRRTPPT